MKRGVGNGVVNERHVGGVFWGMFVVVNSGEERIYGIMCLRVGFCP